MARTMDWPQRQSRSLHRRLKFDTTVYGEIAKSFQRIERSCGKKRALLALQALVHQRRHIEAREAKMPQERGGIVHRSRPFAPD